MRYDSSIYNGLYTGPLNQTSGPYNNVAASQAYFADVTEIPTDVLSSSGVDTGMGAGDIGSMPALPPSADKPGLMGQPGHWWVTLFIVFGIMIFVSRRYGGTEKFGNYPVSIWNLAVATIFMVLMLNFLKVVFSYFKVPGLSTLVAAA